MSDSTIVKDEIASCRQWKTIASMSQRRWGASAVAVTINGHHQIFVIGGQDEYNTILSSCERYDTFTKQWTLLPDKQSMPLGRCLFAAVGIDNVIYVIGGSLNGTGSTCELIALDVTNIMVSGGTTSTTTSGAATSAITTNNDGGMEEVNGERRVIVQDSSSSWISSLAPMKKRRWGCAAVAVNRHIYVFGGFHHDSAERYNIDTNQWEDLPSMSAQREHCVAVAILVPVATANGSRRSNKRNDHHHKIYVIGGNNNTNNNNNSNNMEIFDVSSQSWEENSTSTNKKNHLPPPPPLGMLTTRYECTAVAVAVDDRYLVVLGGMDENDTILSSVDIYDTISRQWKVLPTDMSFGRRGAAAAISFEGQLLVAGGDDGGTAHHEHSSYLSSAEEIWLGDYHRLQQGGERVWKEENKWSDALWAEIFVRVRTQPNLMYLFIKEKPDLFQRRLARPQ